MSKVNWANSDEDIEAQLKYGDELRRDGYPARFPEIRCGNPNHSSSFTSSDPSKKIQALWHNYEVELKEGGVCEGSWKYPNVVG